MLHCVRGGLVRRQDHRRLGFVGYGAVRQPARQGSAKLREPAGISRNLDVECPFTRGGSALLVVNTWMCPFGLPHDEIFTPRGGESHPPSGASDHRREIAGSRVSTQSRDWRRPLTRRAVAPDGLCPVWTTSRQPPAHAVLWAWVRLSRNVESTKPACVRSTTTRALAATRSSRSDRS